MNRIRRLFAGDRVRLLRRARGLTQLVLAEELGISISYLSQIESNDRPLTPTILSALARRFPGDWTSQDDEDVSTLAIEIAEAGGDPSVEAPIDNELAGRTAERQPRLARRMVALHAAYRRSQEQLRVLDDRRDAGRAGASQLPWERVRDWFHEERNYIDRLDRAAEAIAETMAGESIANGIERLLFDRHGIRVASNRGDGAAIRSFDPGSRTLNLDPMQTAETRAFQLAHQFSRLTFAETIINIAASIGEGTSADILATGLANYAAGALLMPYARFRSEAKAVRHDVDRLRRTFNTSFEQTCHRLSTLQRPGLPGIPFFFCRVDMAGNITKRHSATPLEFARFGGTCPLWIVHEAAAIPDRILVQLAEMPDGIRYVCMAKGLVKPSPSFARTPRRYAVALGCESDHAASFIYADGVGSAGIATLIGTSCRICHRDDCDQRAFPPASSEIELDPNRRGAVPYTFRRRSQQFVPDGKQDSADR